MRLTNAAILIGGASRRIGRPKATIVHEGRRLINRAIELAATFADGVFLVARMPDSVTLESVRTTCRLSILRPSDDPTATGPPPNPSR